VSAELNKISPANPAAPLEPIPTPMRLQWRRVRYQVLPALIFTLSLAATGYLWKNYAGNPHGIGEVSALTIRVAAPHDGRLARLDGYPKVFDHVGEHQTVARFDVAHLVTQEEKAQEDLGRLQSDLDAANALVERSAKAGAADASKLNELRQRAATLREAVAAGRNRLDGLSRQIQNATIVAPVSGKVTEVFRQPDEFVKQGQEIMTITPDAGAYIVSYVRPESAIVPKKDMRVVVRNQTRRKSAVSIVQEVGTQVQPIPEHQLVNSKKPEWGIPVRIAMPDPGLLPLMPGELVVLNFESDAAK
jgi:multidrug efflux pump subunit AcrA (membrane-fusion protein)